MIEYIYMENSFLNDETTKRLIEILYGFSSDDATIDADFKVVENDDTTTEVVDLS